MTKSREAKNNSISPDNSNVDGWHILIVDDEKDVHTLTKIMLKNLNFDNRPLIFHSVYNGDDAVDFMETHTDVAIVIMDVVMETKNAGLNAVRTIREKTGNELVRIIIRTGQPGYAPENRIMSEYEISDYYTKTELTMERMHSMMISALRNFRDLVRLKQQEEELRLLLTEREALLMEVQHRVKNNLQLILSLINIETGNITKPSREIIDSISNKIHIFALVHDLPYLSDNLTLIETDMLIIRILMLNESELEKKFSYSVNIENDTLSLNSAVPLALLFNELFCFIIKNSHHPEKLSIDVSMDDKRTINIVVENMKFNIKKMDESRRLLLESISKQIDCRLQFPKTTEDVIRISVIMPVNEAPQFITGQLNED